MADVFGGKERFEDALRLFRADPLTGVGNSESYGGILVDFVATDHDPIQPDLELTTAGRGLAQDDVQIDIGVQQKLSSVASEAAEIDALMNLVQKIAGFVRETRQFGDAVWLKTENAPIFAPEHLSELRQFTSVITLSLRVMTT